MTHRSRQAKHEALQNNLPYFFKNAPIKIKNKMNGQMSVFFMNQAQEYIHEKLEEQLRNTGKIRACIVKGRQQGASTYIGGRYYRNATRRKNKKVFILTHEAAATTALFNKAKEFQEGVAVEIMPDLGDSNSRTLSFASVGSEYQVGTAGAANTGRGTTTDYFHGSEVAFWENTDKIRTGVMQTVPPSPGTEIILESTANGIGGMFHQMCMDAMNGRGEYILIFVPWFWQPEYRQVPPSDFQLEDDDLVYQETYGLDDEQMYWRRLKIIELGSLALFRQEYPANVIEAFQSSGDALISAESILNARKSDIVDRISPLVMGVDPARTKDRIAIAFRRGRQCPHYETFDCTKIRVTDTWMANIIADRIDKFKVKKCFIDCGAGYGAHDILVSRGYGHIVEAVLFGSAATEKDIYINKRVEMWDLMANWFEGGGVSVPDSDELHADLVMVPKKIKLGDSKYKLISKEKIREEYGKSPDIGDALALTFAAPVMEKSSTPPQKATNISHKNPQMRTMKGR